MRDSAEYIQAMVDMLRQQGDLRSAEVEGAMRTVGRHLFAPRVFHADTAEGRVALRSEQDGWWQHVYADRPILTQLDDGAAGLDEVSGAPSSSLSAPGAVAAFLELLKVRPGDRVLEIGTGTGWTAALLTVLAGDGGDVTSIEVDRRVAAQGAANLKAAGYAPRLLTGDGAEGSREHAPFDRIHITCAVSSVPYAWVEQTRPGGVIVAPWQPLPNLGSKLRLTVTGETATGRFTGSSYYMLLRQQREIAQFNPHDSAQAEVGRTRFDPRVIGLPAPGLGLALTALVPRLGILPVDEPDGSWSLLMFEVGSPGGAWAEVDWESSAADYYLSQYGDRSLFDEAVAAWRWWVKQGEPGPERYGLTVRPDGEELWLDRPERVLGHIGQRAARSNET